MSINKFVLVNNKNFYLSEDGWVSNLENATVFSKSEVLYTAVPPKTQWALWSEEKKSHKEKQ
jgi:hypothetical protein